jgi:pimeloyl-ACP methyl ester carboxylesterase
MERRIGPLWADVIEPESAKFTSPLLLIHGLWSSASLWRSFVGYLAHRGWLCVCVHLRHRQPGVGPASVAKHVENLRGVVAALPGKPVAIGHDLGALLAFQIAGEAAAAVALAPLVTLPVASPVPVRGAGWVDRLLRRPLRAPGGRWRAQYVPHFHTGREPQALLRELLQDEIPVAPLSDATPGLILAGEQDPVTPVVAARALSGAVGAALRVESGAGHALPIEAGWERRVSDLHRWIVQQLGRPLLALYDEPMDEES